MSYIHRLLPKLPCLHGSVPGSTSTHTVLSQRLAGGQRLAGQPLLRDLHVNCRRLGPGSDGYWRQGQQGIMGNMLDGRPTAFPLYSLSQRRPFTSSFITAMPKILITRNVGDEAMAKLKATDFELIINPEDAEPSREWVLEKIADPEVVAACIMHGQPGDKVDAELLKAASPNIKVISTFSVGFDHIDVKAANARGIKIGHTPGVLSDAVADITVMLVLMGMRRANEGIEIIKSGEWPQIPWAPFVMCGPSMGAPNLTIGFLGFGRISECVVDRLLAFTNKEQKARVIYTSSRERDNQKEIDAEFSSRWGIDVKRADKDVVAAEADIVIVLCSLSPATTDLVNAAFLKKMKKTAVLVNAARGPIVNTEDLNAALDSGEILGAALDVVTGEPNVGPDHPLVKNVKCAVIPHMGSADFITRGKMADLCVRNAIAGAKGEELPAEVKV